ncbi:MAG: YkgJ family cysteine cluster protein [Clostridiales bacterium]|nr:YkgJ family cysteine cluster protein [Clostridiales bacterium]
MGNNKAEAFLITLEEHQLGHDLRLDSDTATVSDMLEALATFASQRLYKCRGCDGCCHERAPLTALDIPALAELLPAGKYPAQAACSAFADVFVDKDGIVDITLRRDEDGACLFLHKESKSCQHWPARPFVCRSHYCLPRSERLEALRAAIVNNGEDELIRVLIAEQTAGAAPILPQTLDAANYPPNPAFAGDKWQEIAIKKLVPAKLWRKLREL